MADRARSIGQVMNILKAQFPDLSISKIRFLETEGLVSPERAPSGYRRYADTDVERLRYILTMQKNHYLPLKVIREHLDLMDRGMSPPRIESPAPSSEPTPPSQPPSSTPRPVTPSSGVRPGTPRRQLRLSRRELLEASGLGDGALAELERAEVIVPRRGTVYYGREAVTIAIAARRLAPFGIDVRHLTQVKNLANREFGVIEQAVTSTQRRGTSSRAPRDEVVQLMVHLHAALLQVAADR